jgi:bacterioferritin-associated ferredoxin
MIVCVCRGVSDHEIRAVIAATGWRAGSAPTITSRG